MSNLTTRRMIEAYEQYREPQMGFSSLFRTPAENMFNSEEVEFDVMRTTESVAVPIVDRCSGYRENSSDLFTNKSVTPAIYKEATPINSCDLTNRQFGSDPFKDVDYRANLVMKVFRASRHIEAKIKRAIELQCSQVMITGMIDLRDSDGNIVYSLDFLPQASHFPTSATAWNLPGATIFDDISALGDVIRRDGLHNPDMIIMGQGSLNAALANSAFSESFDNRRIDAGIIELAGSGDGLTLQGMLTIGSYRYKLYTYDAYYVDPQTGVSTKYLPDDKVIVKASSGRMDLHFGGIPHIGNILGNHHGSLLPEIPSRMNMPQGGMSMFLHSWISADGQTLWAGVGSRPIAVPTALDTYGTLTTGV